MDRRMDGRTDIRHKNNISPLYTGGDIIIYSGIYSDFYNTPPNQIYFSNEILLQVRSVVRWNFYNGKRSKLQCIYLLNFGLGNKHY